MPNYQIQVVLGNGIVCSGGQGRAERSLKALWGLLASNFSQVCKALVFGFACLVQEKTAMAPAGDWEGSFDSAKRWLCACGHRYQLLSLLSLCIQVEQLLLQLVVPL